MTARLKWTLLIVISVVALGATALIGFFAWQAAQARNTSPSAVDTTAAPVTGDRIVFRNTATGEGYGHIASVPLDNPGAPRSLMDVTCDRVAATNDELACLRTVRGIAPSFVALVLDPSGTEKASWPLAGIPSRTRISADGTLVATTSFVTGHSYATIGFSTETVIRGADGSDHGNLEDFTLTIAGAPFTAVARNCWGIPFADDTTFYATASSGGRMWLVRGDITTRTLTSVAEGVECPSLSPEGTRIAFKHTVSGSGPTVHWQPAVLDLTTGDVTLLPETRNVDDQIEWLDDSTILYGMPRDGVPGDTDVWSLAADGSAAPQVFLEHAWSPSVVRGS